ncbi:MAG: TIGR00725 family protein [Vulcanibacillus sp.]
MRKIIAIIGDSKLEKNSDKYNLAKKLGKLLVDNGYRVISGGMDGVMSAAFEGAKSSIKASDSDTIAIIPSFNPHDANEFSDIIIPTGLDLYRNGIVANSDAVIAIGGGSGTLSEISHAWALYRLVIAFDNVEGWSSKLAGTKIDNRKRYEDIDDKVYSVKSPEEVIDLLTELLELYIRRHKRIV